ncbi:YciI family protein [Actinoplanes friuliensis]|jgi:hypothetical protein|uniref:YCII-like protein n=1 Tax=Actinoplanes friuliensis DSM 7358 TaxID=1246995 RepID=U5W0Z9_9ACTN|nr:hypothetical protein [Actinoplanes friuliensis]AGZ42692.1 YCII-like protein [Actinoplanes friuliensis DSM 7358]
MTKFLLIQHHTAMGTWAPADVQRHYDYQRDLDDELDRAGELVESQGLAGDSHLVAGDGVAGVLPALSGFRIVDVETEDRALRIAARASAAPGPGGAPLASPIDVRRLLTP